MLRQKELKDARGMEDDVQWTHCSEDQEAIRDWRKRREEERTEEH